jgi:CDP-glucose 4,6-dehydratase
MRALAAGKEIPVRNPHSTRPWQHVLEPLSGYLLLGAKLSASQPLNHSTASAFNFGPADESNRTVEELVVEILKHWPGKWRDISDPSAPHEAGLLHLNIGKALNVLGWQPVWDFSTTISKTVEWYRAAQSVPGGVGELTRHQISDYTAMR